MAKPALTKRQMRDGVSTTSKRSNNNSNSKAAVKAGYVKAAKAERERLQVERYERAQRQDQKQTGKPANHKAEARPQSGNATTTHVTRSETPRPMRNPKVRVERAKKLAVRQPNQEIQEKVRFFREKRLDFEKIEPVRIQKALSASGVGSRREMEQWILQGSVKINGKVAQVGDKVGPQDHVEVRGNNIKLKWPDRLPRILLYYKQEGEIVSRDDPQGRVTVFDRLPQAASSRWVAIGRLDVNTSGLLIITTSGALVNRFAHPSFEVEREYSVRVLGEVTTEQMQELTEGVELEDGFAKVERIFQQGGEGANKWYNVVLKEGRNREVRRLFEHLGLTVSRLVRVRFGPIGLPARLKRGSFYELNEFEVANIMRWSGLGVPGDKQTRDTTK
ncbi:MULTISPECIES: pseudouridine synthase [Vitreoscilla]|uniref:Pseudouridine synthase n=1 Tax=Vitreoscilla stercoraria TaxID=61 RepID=A0ABY4ED23_VITST|nr:MULTISPECIES: pseudouridine synthase [Vitreoscilla]AUZ05047.2 pseudouridine synthase [Vitreoscilla sp. C1]UOO93640.1 rRNA pseudouridine synthase [Vitreoscilla stercoraria]